MMICTHVLNRVTAGECRVPGAEHAYQSSCSQVLFRKREDPGRELWISRDLRFSKWRHSFPALSAHIDLLPVRAGTLEAVTLRTVIEVDDPSSSGSRRGISRYG